MPSCYSYELFLSVSQNVTLKPELEVRHSEGLERQRAGTVLVAKATMRSVTGSIRTPVQGH